ncbi:helix-turn-helix domain-containing protein [Candidatus Kirkpatrickella diaphorinae]|uniref:Helix-turn-helix domain-containing protein n=1 Tax=Candidatus Kirkpatrickella diaphorinae TaxID=2984322 RepID=A0ABY6GJ59_9PROT|nr:helix-turn-helix transcriptional regulator [Candidatus Kirkpatrickella diaphorinae]UYH50875.1 helix-turn-helix domain-containing protein [Candidatus Kirkpatrickella diaphorinae]
MHDVGEKLRSLRKARGYNQYDVVAELDLEGFSRSDLSKIERGHKLPSLIVISALADLYDVPLDHFRIPSSVASNKLPSEVIKDPSELALIRAWRAMDHSEKAAFATFAEIATREGIRKIV